MKNKNTQPIEWHKNYAKNQFEYNAKRRKELCRLEADIIRSEKDNDFYWKQIETAKKENRAEFDRDKYLVKRKKLKTVVADDAEQTIAPMEASCRLFIPLGEQAEWYCKHGESAYDLCNKCARNNSEKDGTEDVFGSTL